MAKLAVLATALLLLLAISNATIYQTTIIAGYDGSEFEQFQTSQRCREQMESPQFLQCGQYLMEQKRRPGEVLILRGIRNQQEEQQSQSMRQCCQAMRNMDQQCQCTGLRQLVDKVQKEKGQGQGQEPGQQQQLTQIARQLPEKCGTGRACQDMKVVWY